MEEIKVKRLTDISMLPPGFLVFISSRSGAGKSHLTTWMASMMQKKFHQAIVISPTSSLGRYKQFDFIDQTFHKTPDELDDTLEDIIEVQTKIRQTTPDASLLLICDDVFTSTSSSGQMSTTLNNFVSVRRHWGVSMVLISQYLKNLSPNIRNQCSAFITFVPRTMDDRRTIINNFLTRELIDHSRKKTYAYGERIMDACFKESPYCALMVDCVSTSNRMLDNCYCCLAPPKLMKFKMKYLKLKKKKTTSKDIIHGDDLRFNESYTFQERDI